MSLKKRVPELFRTIAFRLTLWYAGIFSISSCVAFALFYFLATQTLQEQVDQDLLTKTGYFKTIIQRNGMRGAKNLAVIEAQAAGEKMVFFRLLYRSGEVFASSHMSYWKNIKIDHEAIELLMHTRTPVFRTIPIAHQELKARVLYSFVAPNVILQTGIAMDAHTRFLGAFKTVFGISMGFIILFSAVSGMFLARKALSGVKAITRTAHSISGSNLEKRVPETGNKDELDLLASTFNRMLDRIEILVKRIREMSDNIAHDLKSPLTRIRGFAEIALIHRDGREEEIKAYKNMAANTIEESDRLLDMINTMLVISRAEAGEAEFEFARLNLSSMVEDACDLFIPLAEDKEIALSCNIAPDINVDGDARMLQRAFANIVDNAIKYTPEKGKIHVSLEREFATFETRQGPTKFLQKSGLSAKHGRPCLEQACIRVADTGPGILPEYKEKIFDRFFRAESSRTSMGTGLGLSLARTIVRSHKGDVRLEGKPGRGTVFLLTLPYRNL